jgi:capsular polysaccharide biosynthesis protein/MinD-like ATPase involved in chromosome partitioning or flagellar assembly
MNEETFALRDVMRVLRRHRGQLLAIMALAVLAALVVSFGQPRRYTSETQLVVRPTIPGAALPEAPSGNDVGPLGLDLPAETQARILASPLITEQVAARLGRSTDPAQIEELTERVQAKAVTDNLLLITANAPSSREAAALANGYAEEYLEYRRNAARKALEAISNDYQRRARDLQRRAAELGQQIDTAAAQGAAEDVTRLTNERNDLLDQARTLTRGARRAAQSQASQYRGGEIIAPATPPARSSSPNPIRNVVIAILLGVAAGVSAALLREHIDDRVRTRDQAAQAANAPVLAAPPRRRRRARGELVTVTAPETIASEAYRQLHRQLVRRGLGTEVRRLLVTSVEAGPEASETVANLGDLCARTEQATMAIAANPRHSRLHAYLRVADHPPRRVSHQAGAKPPAEMALVTLSALQVTDSNLLVLSSQAVSFSPGELFSSARLQHVFSLAADMAQLLIIEAPPVLGSDDAVTLTAHADATLLVVRAGVDKEALTARAAAILESAGSALLGVVLYSVRKDDDTVGFLDEHRVDRDHLRPAIAPDARPDHATSGNGRAAAAPVPDPRWEEPARPVRRVRRPDGR